MAAVPFFETAAFFDITRVAFFKKQAKTPLKANNYCHLGSYSINAPHLK